MYSLAVEHTESTPPARQGFSWTLLLLSTFLLVYFLGYVSMDARWTSTNTNISSPDRELILGAVDTSRILRGRELWRFHASLFTPMMQPTGENRHMEYNLICLTISLALMWMLGRDLERYYGSAKFLIALTICGWSGTVASFYLVDAASTHPLGLVFACLGISIACKTLMRLRSQVIIECLFGATILGYAFYAGWSDRYGDLCAFALGWVCGFVMPGRGESLSDSAVADALKAALVLLCLTSMGWSATHSYDAVQSFRRGEKTLADLHEAPLQWLHHNNTSYGYSFEYPDTWTLKIQNDSDILLQEDITGRLTVLQQEQGETEEWFLGRCAQILLQDPGVLEGNSVRASEWSVRRLPAGEAKFMSIKFGLMYLGESFLIQRQCYLLPLQRQPDTWLCLFADLDSESMDRQKKQLQRVLQSVEVASE